MASASLGIAHADREFLRGRPAPAVRRRTGPCSRCGGRRHFCPAASTASVERVLQLVGVLAQAAGAHADVDLVVELRVFGADGFGNLFKLFDGHSTAHLSSCSSICSPVIWPCKFAVGEDHGRAAAGADAAGGHEADLAVLGGLALRNAEMFFGRGHQLVGALDVAGRAGADGHGVLARRLEAEVVIEGDHAVGLAERHAQRTRDKADGIVVEDSRTTTARCAAFQSARGGQSHSCAWCRSRSSNVCRRWVAAGAQ